jgi:acetyl esterase
MRYYAESLAPEMMKNVRKSTSFASPIFLVPVIENQGKTGLDPREKALALKTLSSRISTPNTVEAIREQTGFPNTNLNSVEILPSYEDLVYENIHFGLWSYRPRKPFGVMNRPAILYIHGGSWFAGSAATSENACRYLAEKADAVVFNLEQSLAPEHPFPCAYEEALLALKHIIEKAHVYGIDSEKLILSGDSSGAEIACALGLDKRTPRIALEILFYPSTYFDLSKQPPFVWKESDFSMREDEKPLIKFRLGLGRSDKDGNVPLMSLIQKLYVPMGIDPSDPRISPLNGDLSSYPKTLLFTAEYDGLRPQGEFFAHRLALARRDVTTFRMEGVHHGFLDKLGTLPQAEAALLLASESIKNL